MTVEDISRLRNIGKNTVDEILTLLETYEYQVKKERQPATERS